MKILKTLIIISLLIPQLTFGAVTVGWNTPTTATGWISANLVNGINQVINAVAGIFTSASSTFAGSFRLPALSDGCLNVTTGLVGSTGSTCGSSSGSSNPGTVSTSTIPTIGQIPYWTTSGAYPELLGSTATGTITGSTGLSVTAGQFIIGSGLTITNTGVTSISGTAPIVNNLSTGAVQLSCPTCIVTGTRDWQVSGAFLTPTTSITVLLPLGFISQASSTLSSDLFLTSLGQGLLYTGSNSKVNAVATSSASCSGGTSCSAFTVVGSVSPTITSFSYPFPNNATSTLLSFSGGIIANASSTIGGGAQGNGLDIQGGATTSLIHFLKGGFLSTASSTIVGNATTTGVHYMGTASSTNTFGSQLSTCNSASSALTWAAGIFGCNTISAGSGTDPFTHPFNGGSATTTIIGIGTSTPFVNYQLTIASSTAAQLSLSNGAGQAQWVFRNAGSNLYLATTSVAGTATTTTTAMTIVSSTGNVGFGTTSPGGMLSVHADVGEPSLLVGSSSATSFIIDSSGNVGVGTAYPTLVNPNSRLTATKNGAVDIIASSTDNTTLSTAIFEVYAPGSRAFLGAHGASQNTTQYGITVGGWAELGAIDSSFGTSNGLLIGTRTTSKPIVFGNSSLERMRITEQGLVGIGTTTPFSSLQVATSTGAGFKPQFTITDTGAAANQKHWSFWTQKGTFGIATSTDGMATSSIAALTILPTGETGIASGTPYALLSLNAPSTTKPYFSIGSVIAEVYKIIPSTNPIYLLGTSTNDVVQGALVIATTTTAQITLQGNTGEPPWNIRSIGGALYFGTSSASSAATTTLPQFAIATSGIAIFGDYANCNGTTNALGITAGFMLCDSLVSDSHLKKDINPIENGLDIILKLNPVTFFWKDLTNHNTSDPREQDGFIAQEVQKIIPTAIGESPDGYLTLDKTIIIPYIVKSIQTLYHDFQKLIARVSGLEEKVKQQQVEIDSLNERLLKLEQK